MLERLVYRFEEGRASMRDLLGGKGASLAEMTHVGLPVPPGFTLTTEVCRLYNANGKVLPEGIPEAIESEMRVLEEKTGRRFGDAENPLLVSVRSGAPISMPGMMDTILNLGLHDGNVEGFARATGDRRFALDCYRRLIQMFGNVVMGVAHDAFEQVLERARAEQGASSDAELSAESLERVVAEYKAVVEREAGEPFPQDPHQQLLRAVRAVFDSWENERAKVYRRVNKIPDTLGTAVNVQAMVFGNTGDDSGTGVMFTRDPSTGEKVLYGEYLPNAQGEDVVAGIRTPLPIVRLEREAPAVYAELQRIADLLERHYKDMQDLEFTVEHGRVYMLQARAGKRSAAAAVRIAVDMVKEGLIDRETALLRVDAQQLIQLLHPSVDPSYSGGILAEGLAAAPGAATGEVVFSADEAERLGKQGRKVVLVRTETTPDDIHGIVEAQGVLTSHGGMTSHAAVVARGMGKPAVVGCEALEIHAQEGFFRVRGQEVHAGEVITVDGTSGRVFLGAVPLSTPGLSAEVQELLGWADEVRRLGVRANADTPVDAQRSRELGAEGIGLCRTEHMFMAQERLPVVQEMITAQSREERQAALDRLLPMQQQDFYEIFKAMDGQPVIVRLLDPPLHEFLPDEQVLGEEIARMKAEKADPQAIAHRERMLASTRALREFNPMLGFRGCRLGIVYPEINEMQARAIFQAQAQLLREGFHPVVEVMIPLVGLQGEMRAMDDLVRRVARQVMEEQGMELDFHVGTMIEVPRACLIADELAEIAEFFSFGTNDLTQTTFGYSRDDAEGKFLREYLEQKLLPEDPFVSIDERGVGELVRLGIERGRSRRPDLEVGICGEQGGDPATIDFCHRVGMDYVSCSPFRVPIARLAAAQAELRARDAARAAERAEVNQ
ncbi:MAG: pyruvate, phosphate dikinase [Bacillota bacterium]|nr:pyruvate, phosphate dikinase [Bacillota bacterium]